MSFTKDDVVISVLSFGRWNLMPAVMVVMCSHFLIIPHHQSCSRFISTRIRHSAAVFFFLIIKVKFGKFDPAPLAA